ncbi:MAG: hypothetical protein MI867_12095 [Pseudomonadales bacterium]|nr:hypothetical protein [Pseudomonadales bacterium]
MLEDLQSALMPYYIYIKFVHVFFVMIWSWSTAVAYTWYVKGAFLKWEKSPDDPTLIQRRNWAIEQFDKGVVMEHVAFPVILITGPLLYFIGPWNLDFTWLLIKLTVVVFVFLPLEIIDYWLSHFGGNKLKLKKKQKMEQYERAIQQHWRFLKASTPLVTIFIPAVIFLAVVKPA